MRFVHGDVTAMREAAIGSGLHLVLDTGTFHGLNEDQRADGAGGERRHPPDATVVLNCFARRRRGLLPRGASRADVEQAFPEWTITAAEEHCPSTCPLFLCACWSSR
ncbi:MAG: Methyltransferase type 11 [Geminicoccaceae bacterium]|jgi:hypothetical protein|nr:Methyltransferase type 11 [Geminicoccaceae bacterium]